MPEHMSRGSADTCRGSTSIWHLDGADPAGHPFCVSWLPAD
jgi:hypothetical protein